MSAIDLYARDSAGFDGRVAHALALLQAAAIAHAGSIVQSTSLGAEDMVVTDLIARHQLPIAIGTLDTGKLHAETVARSPPSTSTMGWRSRSTGPKSRPYFTSSRATART